MGDGLSYSSLKSNSFSFFFLWVEKKVVGVNEGAHVFFKVREASGQSQWK